ncbi:MAG: lipopolysaccharide biosynthesis protein [Sphingomonadaceae bacterium]
MKELAALPKRLLGRRFAREVLKLQAGSFATMGTQFSVSVIIANLLDPAPFGVYAQARALLDLVNMLANLAVGQALITRLAAAHARGDDEETLRIMAYFLKVGLTVSLVEAAVGLLGGGYLGTVVLNDPEVGHLSRILFVSPPLLVLFNLAVLALQSSRQVGRLALLENGALMATSLLNLIVVALGGGVTGLLYSVAFVPLLTSTAALWLYSATLPKMAGFPTLWQIVRAAPGIPFRRYFAFSAMVSIDKNLANMIALAPTLLLGRLSSAEEVAYFKVASNLTLTILAVPMSPISRNLYAKLAEVRARFGAARIGRPLVQVTAAGLAISATLTLGLVLVAPFVIQLYRPTYLPALDVMYALGVRCALLGFAIGLGPLYQALDIMPLAIVSKIVPAAVMLGAGTVLVGSMGAVGAAWTVTATYLVGDVISAGLVWWILRRESRRAWQEPSQVAPFHKLDGVERS